ncbi:MAG: phosphoribosyltransferase [Chloroflexota bacterium]
MRQVLTWNEVDALIDHLIPQFEGEFDALLMITRGGVVPGGMLAEALDIRIVLTASVHFEASVEREMALPVFLQFPRDDLLAGRRVLIVDDIWSGGRTARAVAGRVAAAGGRPAVAVLHYKAGRSLFRDAAPDYYAAVTDDWIVYPWEAPRDMIAISPVSPGIN